MPATAGPLGADITIPQAPELRGTLQCFQWNFPTTSQCGYLDWCSYIPSYLAEKSGSSRIRSDFWPPIWEEFFERWPLQLISDKEKEEDKVDPDHLEKAKTVSILSVYNVDITHVTT